jgi:hypothetical protein
MPCRNPKPATFETFSGKLLVSAQPMLADMYDGTGRLIIGIVEDAVPSGKSA